MAPARATTGSDDGQEEADTAKPQPASGSAPHSRGADPSTTTRPSAPGGNIDQTVQSRTQHPDTASDTAFDQSGPDDGPTVANGAGLTEQTASTTKSEIVRYNINENEGKNTSDAPDRSPPMVYRTPTSVAPEAQQDRATERRSRGTGQNDHGTSQSISTDALSGTDRRMERESDEPAPLPSEPAARRERRLHQAGSGGERSPGVTGRSQTDRSSGDRPRSPSTDDGRPSLDTPGPAGDGPTTQSESTRQRTVRGPQDVTIPIDGLQYEADVDRVVERLYRKLERKRRIERERRGQR
ncbi:hypothetical protein [Natranaeroarchaeum aerophilus]|uniref:Uncharacterized protein n=1 Tax=Natranaeroarchaeum aerophilus TaxID=2917711 RepID=A0AAE3FMM9_9EURY|nr:hypothetical protein [Natranaeroarchaeum aerophilus]MCL9812064.1 hypothetical protein [Natranaeroarchaeum aerophilus]